jgi:hypothetical protein
MRAIRTFHPECPKCHLPMKKYKADDRDEEKWGCKRHEHMGVWMTVQGMKTAGRMRFLYPPETEGRLMKDYEKAKELREESA